MKKYSVLFSVVALVIAGVIIYSCQKDQQPAVSQTPTPVLKDLTGIGIYMGQDSLIGTADITFDWATYMLCIDVTLDYTALGDYEVQEAHYYGADIGEGIPPYPQGRWDGEWYAGSGDPFGHWCWYLDPTVYTAYYYTMTCPDGSTADAYSFEWYFALHLQLYNANTEDEETAWMLSPDYGENWYNGGSGKTKGWGEYLDLSFSGDACPD